MFDSIAPGILNYIVIAIIAGGVSYLLAWYRSPRCQYGKLILQVEKLSDNVEKLHRENKLIKKCLIIKAKMIDEQTKIAHPKSNLELEEIVREMLKTNGN